MSAKGHEFVIAYDVTSDRERSRVDKLVKGFGFRAQKSVFECRLTRRDRAELVAALERLALKTGSVRIYRRQAGTDVDVVGVAGEVSPDEGHAFVI